MTIFEENINMPRPLRNFIVFLCCIAVAACNSGEIKQMQEQLRQHEEEIQRLKAMVESVNNSVSALQTTVVEMESGGYVTAVIPDEQNGRVLGYWLSFGSGKTIYLSTGEEATPKISVRSYKGGDYYWTLDNEFLQNDEGEMIAVGDAATPPLLKAEEDDWFISMDGAVSWTLLEKAYSAASIIKSIDTSNPNYVIITLSNGTVLQLTTWSAYITLQNLANQQDDDDDEDDGNVEIWIEVPEDYIFIGLGETVSYDYHLSGTAIENASVTAFSDGNFVVSISRVPAADGMPDGTLKVTCIREFETGYVTVLLIDANGKISPKVIPAVFKTTPVEYSGDSYQLKNGQNYIVPATGGVINKSFINQDGLTLIHATDDWIHFETHMYLPPVWHAAFSVDENDSSEDRYMTFEHWETHDRFRIKQEGNPAVEPNPYWEVDRITFPPEGGSVTINVTTKSGKVDLELYNSYAINLYLEKGKASANNIIPVTISADSASQNAYGAVTKTQCRAEIKIDCGYGSGVIEVTQLSE